MKIHRVQWKNIVAVLFFTVVGLFGCGCLQQSALMIPVDEECWESRRRECSTNNCQDTTMSWREFRPFRILLPPKIKVECCNMDEGRMVMIVPEIDAPIYIFRMPSFFNVIDVTIIALRISFCSLDGKSKVETSNFWYTEKRFSDRRMLMYYDETLSSGSKIYCFCEFDSGECLNFAVDLGRGDVDRVSEWLWCLCRNLKFEIKCHDAFSCSREEAPINVNRLPTVKLKWNRIEPKLGAFEWRSLRQLKLFVPSSINIETCFFDDNHFCFDLPGKRHYVCVDFYGESNLVEEQSEFYSYSDGILEVSLSPEEKKKVQFNLDQKQILGIDWYMDETFDDRRLLVEHRHQGENCEGVVCYCEYENGECVKFCIRGSGTISKDELDYFLLICQTAKVMEIRTCLQTIPKFLRSKNAKTCSNPCK